MSTKHVRTTGDLIRFKCALKVECMNCGSARTFNANAAFKGLGMADLGKVGKRFRCLRCGAKEAKVAILPPTAISRG